MQVQDLMTHPAVTCRPSDSLDRAARLMYQNDYGAIPVVYDDGRLAGIITDRDIAIAAHIRGGSLRSISVSSAMTKDIIACAPDESIRDIEHLMSSKQIRRVPVVDDSDRPMGMLSLNDIARNAISDESQQAEVALTLASICQPGVRRRRVPTVRQKRVVITHPK